MSTTYEDRVARTITQYANRYGRQSLGDEVLRNLGLSAPAQPAPQTPEQQLHERLRHELSSKGLPASVIQEVLDATDPADVVHTEQADQPEPQAVRLQGTVTFEVEVVVDGTNSAVEGRRRLEELKDVVYISLPAMDDVEILSSRITSADLR